MKFSTTLMNAFVFYLCVMTFSHTHTIAHTFICVDKCMCDRWNWTEHSKIMCPQNKQAQIVMTQKQNTLNWFKSHVDIKINSFFFVKMFVLRFSVVNQYQFVCTMNAFMSNLWRPWRVTVTVLVCELSHFGCGCARHVYVWHIYI